jgi:hypothetical protein
MRPDDFDSLRNTAVDSRVWRALTTASQALASAWEHSRFRRECRTVMGDVRAWNLVERVRWAAVAIVSAALGHLALLSVSPAYVEPGLPRAAVVTIAIAAALVAIAPDAFANAWRESRLGGICRRFSRPAQNKDA